MIEKGAWFSNEKENFLKAFAKKYNLDDLTIEEGDDGIEVREDGDDLVLALNFREPQELDHCCGVLELGGFGINNCIKKANRDVIKLVALLLKSIVDDHCSISSALHKALLFTITPTTSETQKLIGDAAKLTGLFQKVHSFRNSNSQNIVEIWTTVDLNKLK